MKNLNVLFFCFVVSMLACNGRDSRLNELFMNIEDELLDKGFLEKIKEKPDDSLYYISGTFMYVYTHNMPADLLKDSIWPDIAQNKFAGLDQEITDEIFVHAFKKYLNNEEINLDEIKNNVVALGKIRLLNEAKTAKRIENELKAIIEYNNRTYQPGDTLKIHFPLRGDEHYYTIYYNVYPSASKYNYPDDTLKMSGILLSKFYDKESSGHDSLDEQHPLNLFFILKITSLSHNNAHKSGSDALKVGDTINLPLEFYGEQIR